MFKDSIKIWFGFTLCLISWSVLIIILSSLLRLSDGLTFSSLIAGWGVSAFFWGWRFWIKEGPWKKMRHSDRRIFVRFLALGISFCGFFIYTLFDLFVL